MTKKNALVLALATLFAACGVDRYGEAPASPTPDAATPPPAADAAAPTEDAAPAEPERELCRLVGQESATREGCDACEEARWRCGPDLEWYCDDAVCVAAPTEDAGTPPPPAEDAGSPESDAGTPPLPPAMEDAGTPPPADLCAGHPARACSIDCVGAGIEICDPETGEYGDCDVSIPLPCADAGPPPPPAADAGPTCTPTVEVCDGIDNDCDGETDEASPSTPLSESCYGGPAGTDGVAACRAGVRLCVGGSFSECLGQVTPTIEICGNGLDEDCNGSDLACAPAVCSSPLLGTPCSTSGTGACIRTGTYVCSPSGSPACSVTTPGSPTTEICGDAIDQDCNGSDLACSPPTSDVRTVIEATFQPQWGAPFNLTGRVPGTNTFYACQSARADRPLAALPAGRFRCIIDGRPDPVVLAFLSDRYTDAAHPDIVVGGVGYKWLHSANDWETGSCALTSGMTISFYDEATGTPIMWVPSPGACGHDLLP